jgi:DNA-binding CsgD family transcriptional regulator/tetratricopeptide (TPR) repeat protein
MASVSSAVGHDAPAALLERAAELDSLTARLAAVGEAGRGQVLLLGGEAGVGKTTLLRRFAQSVEERVCVLWGGCDPLFAPRPLGPLVGVARTLGADLERLVEHGAMPYDVVAALQRELARVTPALLVVDDVHWADEATLDVLRLLARHADRTPALVVATFRDDGLAANHPLRLVLGELATSRDVARMKLAPLSREAVGELADARGLDADELFRKTGGNPFFVAEVIAGGDAGIPETVRDAVLARAARLSLTGQALLEAVAIVPPEAELWLVDAVARESAAGLDECLAAGMLVADRDAVRFRHELARLAIEESIPPHRARELHRRVLDALQAPPGGSLDLARLAHHADATSDGEAVLRFAPDAAERAVAAGAYREAAAQYARALRFGAALAPAERAELLERRSRVCYVTDQHEEAVAAIREAADVRRSLGDRLAEGEALCWLSLILWCPGMADEARRVGKDSIDLLETLPPSSQLARAYHNYSMLEELALRPEAAIEWAERALALAERLHDVDAALEGRRLIASCSGGDDAWRELEDVLATARSHGLTERAGLTYVALGGKAAAERRGELGARWVNEGIEYCEEHGLERDRLYLVSFRARLALDADDWAKAARDATAVIRMPRTSISPRITALVVLALVRARRGDPEAKPLLDEALALALPTGELLRSGPVAAAAAEVAWLEGRSGDVAAATDAALAEALELGSTRLAAELRVWRARAGLDGPAATDEWRPSGRYETALALFDADEDDSLRRALEELQELGARPAANIVSRRLRERGARGLPRGPRPSTRQNPAGLTGRELEVLELVAQGLRNTEIAGRLVVSERTIDHHVGAILRKLDVRSRTQATAEAVRLGLVAQDP